MDQVVEGPRWGDRALHRRLLQLGKKKGKGPSALFWELWPRSKDVSEVDREKLTVSTKTMAEETYAGIPRLNAEVARMLSIELCLGECIGEVSTENYNLDICASRKETMLRTLTDFNSHITFEGITALAARIPWLTCLAGSALSHLMENLRKGIAYMHYVEEMVGMVTDRKKVLLVDRARGSFFTHVLRELGCEPEKTPFCNSLYYLPLGLAGKIKNEDAPWLLSEAISSFPPFSLGGGRFLTGKQLWNMVTRNRVALPGKDALPSEDTEQPRHKRKDKKMCSYVQEFLRGYGFEWVYKPEFFLSELRVIPANKKANKKRKRS